MIAELEKPKRSSKPHWYRIYVGECPVCGRDHGYRLRMYTERPADIQDRYEYLPDNDTYDHCQDGV